MIDHLIKGYYIGAIKIKFADEVPTFNSCTKCVASIGIIHDRTPDCHSVSWAWMRGSLMLGAWLIF